MSYLNTQRQDAQSHTCYSAQHFMFAWGITPPVSIILAKNNTCWYGYCCTYNNYGNYNNTNYHCDNYTLHFCSIQLLCWELLLAGKIG